MKARSVLLMALVLWSSIPVHATIQCRIIQDPNGVTFSYSGTWDVGPGGNTDVSVSRRVELFVVTNGYAFNINGDALAAQYYFDPLVEEVSVTGSLPTYTFPGTEFDVEGVVLTGAEDDDAFVFDVYDTGVVSIYGPNGGWSAGDSVNGSAFFVGLTLADLGLGIESGSFTVGGQTIDWSVSTAPATATVSAMREATLTNSAGFGSAVAIDGDTAVIGAEADNSNAGAAYVYILSNTVWTFQQKLTAPDGMPDDVFGSQLDIEGDRLVIAAPGDNEGDSPIGAAGAIYVFNRSGSTWSFIEKIVSPDPGDADGFGYAVSISGDVLLVGEPYDNGGYSDSGAVFAYTWNSGTTSWDYDERLTPGDPSIYGFFGYSIWLEGDQALIGSYGNSNYIGAVYAFENQSNTWTQTQKLTASDGEALDSFGYSVDGHGDFAVVGALNDSTYDVADYHGSAYCFERIDGVWSESQKLLPAEMPAGAEFGASVAISDSFIAIGAQFESTQAEYAGAVYAFSRGYSCPGYLERLRIASSAPAVLDTYGNSVALDGNTLIVGAVGHSDGQAEIFLLNDTLIDSDGDGAGDTWEIANGYDENLANNFRTLDSDGDGQTDLAEIFKGVDKNDPNDVDTFESTSIIGASDRFTFGTLMDPDEHTVLGVPMWSTDLANWYFAEQNAEGLSVDYTLKRFDVPNTDIKYNFHDFSVTGGSTDKLFFRFGYCPNE